MMGETRSLSSQYSTVLSGILHTTFTRKDTLHLLHDHGCSQHLHVHACYGLNVIKYPSATRPETAAISNGCLSG